MAENNAHTPGRTGVISTVASLASLVAALSCCLPLGTLLMAAGSAGAALFSERLRPGLLTFSVAALIFAFVETYYRRRCEFRHRRLRTVFLWLSAVLIAAMLAAPRATSTLLTGRLPSFSASGVLYDFDEQDFARRFDAAIDETRVVVLLSPT